MVSKTLLLWNWNKILIVFTNSFLTLPLERTLSFSNSMKQLIFPDGDSPGLENWSPWSLPANIPNPPPTSFYLCVQGGYWWLLKLLLPASPLQLFPVCGMLTLCFFLDFTCPGGFRQAPQGLGPSVLRVEVTVVHLALLPFLWHIVLDPKLRAWVVPYLSMVIFQASAFWSVDRA